LQLGIFWIATAWLATGLYVGPAVGTEPPYQRLGVNVLLGALLVVVVGSMAGQWFSVMGKLGTGTPWFWLGHSGYEYIDLGRLWQILLLIGLFLYLALVARAVWPALQRKDDQRPVLALFLISAAAIAGFYTAALGYGRHTTSRSQSTGAGGSFTSGSRASGVVSPDRARTNSSFLEKTTLGMSFMGAANGSVDDRDAPNSTEDVTNPKSASARFKSSLEKASPASQRAGL
jgi:hypothetical protein